MRTTFLTSLLLAAPAWAFEPTGLVVFMSDFGIEDDAVALCKGVMLSIDPTLRIIDLTHDVTPFHITEGAHYLAQAGRTFPAGTVFVGVVDPGVGTERRAIAVETGDNQVYVVPDNGLAWLAMSGQEFVGAWEITNPVFMVDHPSDTFHGRDLFSPAGAVLASGIESPSAAGPPASELVQLDLPEATWDGDGWRCVVGLLDKSFGNVWTNLSRQVMSRRGTLPARLRITIGTDTHELPLVRTFGDVPEGAPLAYFNSRDRLSFALNLGSFAATHDVHAGDAVEVVPLVTSSR